MRGAPAWSDPNGAEKGERRGGPEHRDADEKPARVVAEEVEEDVPLDLGECAEEKEDQGRCSPEPGRRNPRFLHEKTERSEEEGTGEATACLLYTSPSPRDRTRSRMPSSA